jgi:hypothetical protein
VMRKSFLVEAAGARAASSAWWCAAWTMRNILNAEAPAP